METVVTLIVLVLTLLAMIFEKKIGIKLSISGCIGALILILTGVISEKEALKSLDLKTIFLFGGTLSLASALAETGAGETIANTVIGALGSHPSPYILTFVVFILCCVMTNFMSNTATTGTDGSNLSFHCGRNGGGPESSTDGMCDRRFLCLCDTDRHAGKYHGRRSRRISLYGLCKSRIPTDHNCNDHQHDYFTDCISVFPIRKISRMCKIILRLQEI